MTRLEAREEAVALHRFLADPALDAAILAEGNASVKVDDGFWVKGSGRCMATLTEADLAFVPLAPVLETMNLSLSDPEIASFLIEVAEGPKPSVETFLHAALLSLPDVRFVAHAHPTALLGLLSSPDAELEAARRYFPDEVVLCGRESLFVPYADPGIPLAQAVLECTNAFIDRLGHAPSCIWLGNHGLVTLGNSRAAVESAFAMTIKASRVRLAGATVPLSAEAVARIDTRPDEHDRQRELGLRG